MVLGPRQFEWDTSGKGAVLCIWSIYLTVQARVATCGLARRPVDDAIDKAIVTIDEFVLSNFSLRPTRPMLEDFKRRASESELNSMRRLDQKKICEGRDLEVFRSLGPDKIRETIQSLLALPREPVMNPCL